MSIGDDITRLIRRTPQQSALATRNTPSSIAAKRGSSRPNDKPPDASSASGGGGVPCQITGHGDTINDYLVSLYEDWPSTTPSQTDVACKQLQIGGTMRIKAGAWAIAFQINTSWFIQVPVWVEKEPIP